MSRRGRPPKYPVPSTAIVVEKFKIEDTKNDLKKKLVEEVENVRNIVHKKLKDKSEKINNLEKDKKKLLDKISVIELDIKEQNVLLA